MTSWLERATREAWRHWGPYAGQTECAGCQLIRYCRWRRRSRPLCVDCYGQGLG